MLTKRTVKTALGSLVVAVLFLGAACSSDDKDDASSSSSSGSQTFSVDTPDGALSLSLNGALPPNWPSTFPTPSGATPAGSGSLVNASRNVQVGVYDYSGEPSNAFNFYKTNPSLTVNDASAIGGGSNYVGTMKLSGSYSGNIYVVALGGTTRIVVLLTGSGGSSGSSSSSRSSSSSSSSTSSSSSENPPSSSSSSSSSSSESSSSSASE